MAKAKVAVLKVNPETILEDIERLCALARHEGGPAAGQTTILKDNISWHYPFPGGQHDALADGGDDPRAARTPGFADITCVQNKTVVTNAFKGEDLNHYVPLFKKYDDPRPLQLQREDMRWVEYRPKAQMHVLHKIFPDGIQIPDYFFGKNIVHLPTVKCHIYTTTTGAMKNAFGGLLATQRHYTHSWIHRTLVDLLAIQKEIHSGLFAIMDGTTAGNGPGPRTMFPVIKDYMLASRRSDRHRRRRREDDGLRSDEPRVHQASRTTTGSAWAIRATSRSSATTSRTRAGASRSATTAPARSATSCGSAR